MKTVVLVFLAVFLAVLAITVHGDDHEISDKCLHLTKPPWFVRVASSKTPEEYYAKSVESGKRCCPQLNEDGDISECKCPLTKGKYGKRMEKKFLKKQTAWCKKMIKADCFPDDVKIYE